MKRRGDEDEVMKRRGDEDEVMTRILALTYLGHPQETEK